LEGETIRVGVVGLGPMGRRHAHAYAALDGSDLIAVTDHHQETIDQITAETGAHAVSSLAELAEKVDAVSIATPSPVRAEVAVPLLEAGVACLIEKPMAPTLDEADALIAAADRGNAPLMVGHIERFNPAVELLQKWLDIAKAEIRSITAVREGPLPARETDLSVIYDLMLHDLDIARCLCPGDSIASLEAQYDPGEGRGDAAVAGLTLESGVTVSLVANRRVPNRRRELMVTTNIETLVVDLLNRTVRTDGERKKSMRVPDVQPLNQELLKFLDAVRGYSRPWPDGREARETLAWLAALEDAIPA